MKLDPPDGQYIRDFYGVPAHVGRRIRFTYAEPREGKIVGFDRQYLMVRFDDGSTERLHPTWEVTYL